MSDETPRDPKATYTARDSHDSNRSGLKWLAGAAAVAVLLGGGYYVWNNRPAVQPNSEIAAYDAQSSTTPFASGSSTSTADATVDSAAIGEGVSTTSSTRTSTSTGKRPAVRADAAAEEIVGVSPVSAMRTDENEIVITGARRPVWSSKPSARRLSALYPARALERGKEGEASVHCTVQERGALDCVPVSEMPANAGFSTAALRVARTYRHAALRADGSAAVGTPVNLRVMFRIADEGRRT